MKLTDVANADGAIVWLREKIDEGWTANQMREMVTLTTELPPQSRDVLNKVLDKMEEEELENWARSREIRCETCGHRKVMTLGRLTLGIRGAWFPGMRCPECSSERFYPTVEMRTGTAAVFHRYWKVNPIVSFTLILFIVAGLCTALRSASPKGREPEEVTFICLSCGKFFYDRISYYPIRCHYCDERKGLMAIQCKGCGKIFVWPKINWEKQPPVCPDCGSKENAVLKRIPK